MHVSALYPCLQEFNYDRFLVAAYHPDSHLTLGALNKLQVGAGINLLSTLEKSPESLGDLQRLVGFDLSDSSAELSKSRKFKRSLQASLRARLLDSISTVKERM